MRKYKLILAVVALFSLHYAKAQSTNEANKTDFFPVSPQAGTLGKYGDIPVDLCTGKVNFTIPIYTIKDGDFEFPIQLSYNYNGLQVGETFGQVGAGWSINSSGYISVATRGGSDFNTFNSLGYIVGNVGRDLVKPYLNGEWNSLPVAVREEKKYNLFSGAASGRLDTEPDKYIVNSGSLNFSFYLDEMAKPIFSNEYKNYKIDLFSNFRITDDKGNKYVFGKAETTELLTSDNTTYDINSAYNLTSIETSKNRTINFSYYEDSICQEVYSDQLIDVAGPFSPRVGCPSGRSITQNSACNKIIKNNVSEIVYSNGRITFTYFNDNSYKGNRLKQIRIYDKNNLLINRFELIYNEGNSLLLEIKKYDGNNMNIPFYKLEYYGNIPNEISSKSQDSWGYFNGQNNNYLVTGNRSVNFNNTRLGALQKITYPTGGFTEIEYEQNISQGKIYTMDCSSLEFNKIENVTAFSNSENNHQSSHNIKEIYIPFSQRIRIDLNSNAGNSTGCIDEVITSANFRIGRMDTPHNIYDVFVPDGCSPNNKTLTQSRAECEIGNVDKSTIIFTYGPGYITIEAGTTETISTASISTATLSYNNIEYKEFPAGGIRVKSIKDYDKLGGNYIQKKYQYLLDDNLSSGITLYENNLASTSHCGDNTYRIIHSKSILPLDSYNGSPVFYTRVKEDTYGGTNFKNSKIYNYSKGTSYGNSIEDSDNKNMMGKLLSLNNLDSNSNSVYTEKYTYSYFNFNAKTTLGFKSKKIRTLLENILDPRTGYISFGEFDISDYYQTKHYGNQYDSYNLIKKETEIINSNGTISKTEDYQYNSFNQLSKQITKSSANDVLETKYFYPQDPQMATKPFVNELKTANIVGVPLETQTLKNGQLLSKQETVYAKDATTNNLLLPKTILAAKGTQTPETKITYNSYDNKGNVTQYTPEGGIPVAVIWGYNQTVPIAKIENASYAQVQSYVANLQTLSNGTNENALIVALNSLRINLPNAMVTTYTHKPLVGVSTITDPKGNKVTYTYDSFNRLQSVKDHQGNTINENEYHYRPN